MRRAGAWLGEGAASNGRRLNGRSVRPLLGATRRASQDCGGIAGLWANEGAAPTGRSRVGARGRGLNGRGVQGGGADAPRVGASRPVVTGT